jgi:non-specific serine/threonine protein kinase
MEPTPVTNKILATVILPDGHLSLEWESSSLPENHERKRLEKLLLETCQKTGAGKSGEWLIVLGLSDPQIPLSPVLVFWQMVANTFIRLVRNNPESDALREKFTAVLLPEDRNSFMSIMPAMTGIEYAGSNYLDGVWELLSETWRIGIKSFQGGVEEWFKSLAPGDIAIDRIHFHLVENRKDESRPFAFLATYTTRVDEQGRMRHQPLKSALSEFAGRQDKLLELLATVNKVAKKNSLIASLLESGELFQPVGFSTREASSFLSGVPDFEAAGILCRIPRWWKGSPSKFAVGLSIGNGVPSKMNRDALLDFKAELLIDGETISEADARRILANSDGLALIKGKWVAVDAETLAKTLDLFKEAKRLAIKQQCSFAEAMRLLRGDSGGGAVVGISGAEVTCGDWLKGVLEKMTTPALIRTTEPSKALKAELRPYQQQGLNWLSFLHSLGFGICLADDMGLGKTVEILSFLQTLKKPGRTSLCVVPASLLENWRREIEKFTPDLKVVILHTQATNETSLDDLCANIDSFDIAITTYGMLGRCEWISEHTWFYVICDEAQAIKNPGTKQTKSVKMLKSVNRIVMTGTPVENRLSDLWSLFDFINPGLLGAFNEFKRFAKGLEERPEGYGHLRQVVHPYILRRSKTDRSIISDLPEKVEMKTYCSLSRAQTVLYGDVVKRLERELETVDGIKRKGIVLGYLMKCKQLCNHPDHFSGAGVYNEDESGKFKRLAELCETIREKRERVLVFTQFAEIIAPLSLFLEKVFGATGLTLSGSSSMKQRKEAVDKFQGIDYTPFFVLSLKAGGVGLNLTAANHVIHFDRWWNPAVENQATDRAFRIGQKKNVMVHKFICSGTIEEKIDSLIEDKKALANEIVPSSAENWITELDDRQVKDLFRLTLTDSK